MVAVRARASDDQLSADVPVDSIEKTTSGFGRGFSQGTDISDADPRKHVVDKRNPIGRGFVFRHEKLVDSPAPCIEYPGGDLAKIGPAGFGPIASYWSPRLELWGTFDKVWEKTKKPLLPDDYNDRVVLCSGVVFILRS